MNDLFVDTHLEKPQTIGYAEACKRLRDYNPGSMFPAQITYSVLTRYGFPQVRANFENEALPYSKPSIVFIGQDESGSYFMDIRYERSEATTNQAYDDYRAERNKLLAELDWVESSPEVTQESKKAVALYKQILRDLPNSSIDFEAVVNKVFPPKPNIAYKADKATKRKIILSDEQFERIKTYKPRSKSALKDWNRFLSVWESYGFTRDLDLVLKLTQLICNKELKEIVE